MSTSQWAQAWLAHLVKEGGAHGPGSSRAVELVDDRFTYSQEAEKDLEKLHRGPQATSYYDPSDSSYKAAVTYEKTYEGSSALWIDAVRIEKGQIVERLRFVQPYKKKLFGKCSPLGTVQNRSSDFPTS